MPTSKAPSEATFAEDKAAAKDPRNVARAKVVDAQKAEAMALDESYTAKVDALNKRIAEMNK
jgi:hypothetical protein